MKTRIVRIGNSRGVRIPKAILEETGLRDDVELEVRRGVVVLRPASKPRSGWEEAFRRMAREGDDTLLDPDVSLTRWDATEWTW